MLQLEFHPEGAVEKAGDMLGVVSHRVKGDLERFKTYIEDRGTATGTWRGEVEPPPQHEPTGTPSAPSFTSSEAPPRTAPRTEEDPNAIAHGIPPTPPGPRY